MRLLRMATPVGKWCPGEDSNLHGLRHWYLKPARLPIPPPGPRAVVCGDRPGMSTPLVAQPTDVPWLSRLCVQINDGASSRPRECTLPSQKGRGIAASQGNG